MRSAFLVFTMGNVGLPGNLGLRRRIPDAARGLQVRHPRRLLRNDGRDPVCGLRALPLPPHHLRVLDKPALKSMADMSPREIAVLAPLVILTIYFGFYPAPVLDVTAASVKSLVSAVAETQKAAALVAP